MKEAELLVERDAWLIGQRDGADRGDIALPFENANQGFEKRPADAAALCLRIEIDSGLDRPAIGPPGAECAAGRKAQQPSVLDGDEPRVVARHVARHAPR